MAEATQQKATILPAPDMASAGDFIALMKPRVMSLVLFTAFIGMVMAPVQLHIVSMLTALLFIALGAGASAALNMWYDADIDAVMQRTRGRVIPQGRVSRQAALSFGLWVSGISVLSMMVLVNYLSAALLAFTIFFYAVVYTIWLKRHSTQNIVIGGLAGALPPVIGWAATGAAISLEPLIYCALIFFWTPPHFWALAIVKDADYRAANIPMLPSVASKTNVNIHIFLYTIVVSACALSPYLFGYAGFIYGLAAALLSGLFVILAGMLFFVSTARRPLWAGRIFGFSIFYLFALFALLPLDRLWGF